MTRIFVYGSLKQNFPLHGALTGQRFIGEDSTVPGFRLFSLGSFPAMVADPSGGEVEGEVYDVDADTLRWLDQIEGEGRMYKRTEIELWLHGAAEAYLYLRSVEGLDEVGSCWKQGEI